MKWNIKEYQQNASYVYKPSTQVLSLLDPQPNESILDLGAGSGQIAQELINTVNNIDVLCVDRDENMVQSCKDLGLNAICQSADKLNINKKFDAVFSNAVLNWIKDADSVIMF